MIDIGLNETMFTAVKVVHSMLVTTES